MGTVNFSAKYLSKKDSSTMLPELTEFVPAARLGIVRKVLLGLENRAGCIFSLLLNAFEWRLRFKIWNWVGTLSFHGTAVIFWDIVQTGAQFDFLSRQIVRPKLTKSFPFNYMLKSKFSLSRHFEYANEQITYHFWLCGIVDHCLNFIFKNIVLM